MFRVKKLLFYTIFLITGVLFLLCIQNRFRINSYNTKDDNEKPKELFPSSINNAKIRKLAEKETIKISLKNITISTSKISIHNDITTSSKQSTTTTTTTSTTTVSSTDPTVSVSDRPWYMIGGERRPNHDDQPLPIFPEDLPNSDRIPGNLDLLQQSYFICQFCSLNMFSANALSLIGSKDLQSEISYLCGPLFLSY